MAAATTLPSSCIVTCTPAAEYAESHDSDSKSTLAISEVPLSLTSDSDASGTVQTAVRDLSPAEACPRASASPESAVSPASFESDVSDDLPVSDVPAVPDCAEASSRSTNHQTPNAAIAITTTSTATIAATAPLVIPRFRCGSGSTGAAEATAAGSGDSSAPQCMQKRIESSIAAPHAGQTVDGFVAAGRAGSCLAAPHRMQNLSCSRCQLVCSS